LPDLYESLMVICRKAFLHSLTYQKFPLLLMI